MSAGLHLVDQLEDDDDRADLTPLIDIVFLLLLFFIVTATFSEQSLFEVELPTATEAVVRSPQDAVELVIAEDGRYAIGREFIPDRLLPQRLAELGEGKTTLVIKGDANCPYAKVVQAVDIAQAQGVVEYALVVQRSQ
ncbi:MAG: biopolymer transporter ExbD [Planctomycetota bacterium]|nr:biopolymer transporter ExbD [Planctomycetota bacterium]